MVDQLPENIDVTYTRSDVGESEEVGSDKFFSDVEVPIQNVFAEKIEKVFELVEIEKSKIDKFAGKVGKKAFYNKPSYKKKNTKVGLGYKRKKNRKKRFEKYKVSEKDELCSRNKF
ncbi:hypothetical protein Hanom_Chr17g01551661 [Helianthus anomalus]